MPSVAFVAEPTATARQRLALLLRLGYESRGLLHCNKLVRELQAHAPDQVIFHSMTAVELLSDDSVTALMQQTSASHAITLWLEQAPTPSELTRALQCGVSELLLGEVAAAALQMALQLASVRWQHRAAEQEKTAQVQAQAQAQLSERKWVERAKGVLMNAQGLGEDDAFRLLRGTAMHAKLQMAEVSRSVIEAAQWAEAMNRSGQLRMLSQRLLKLAVQRHLGLDARRAHDLQADTVKRIDDNLAFLVAVHDNTATAGSLLSTTIAPSLQGVRQAWGLLREALATGPSKEKTKGASKTTSSASAAALVLADERAEALLQSSEALTQALAATSGRSGLNVVNLCGRQRMRVQRLAKQALLSGLLQAGTLQGAVALDAAENVQAFEQSLRELEAAPLSSAEIRDLLVIAREQWLHLVHALRGPGHADARATLCGTSESLLETFDRLTACYEHSLQVILG
jgi:AmiR/NasT family two-component response regulator